MMRGWMLLTMMMCVILTISTHAQDETGVITADNIAQLTELEVIGRGVITNAIYSPDGAIIAVAGSRGIWLYNAQNLDEEPRLLNGHHGPVTTIAFSPDGRLLASGSTDEFIIDPDIHLWDVVSGEMVATLTGHTDGVGALAFHPSGDWLVSSSWEYDETVRVWEMNGNTAEQVAIVPSPDHDDEHAGDNGATDIEVDAQGENLAIAFWDSRKGLSDYSGTIETIAFEDLLAGVANFQLVQITGIFPLFVSYHPTLSKFAYSGFFRMGIWDSAQQTKLFYGNPDEKRGICDVAYDPTGQFLAIASANGRVIFWDADTNEYEFAITWDATRNPNGESDYIPCRIAFSPDGLHLLVINKDNTIQFFDVQSQQRIHTIDFNFPIQHIAFQDSNNMLAIFQKPNGEIDFAGVDLSQATLSNYPFPYKLKEIVLSNDGRQFAFVIKDDESTSIYIHDIVEHQTRYFLRKENSTTIMYFDGEKNLLYLCDYVLDEKWIYIWDVEEESLLVSFMYPDSGYFWIGAFLPTENPYIAYISAGYGNDAHRLMKINLLTGDIEPIGPLWGSGREFVMNEDASFIIATYEYGFEGVYGWGEEWNGIEVVDLYTGELLRLLSGHILPVKTLNLSPDGTLLASGSLDGTVQIWDIETGEQLAVLDTHTDSITQVLFNEDGTRLATASEDGTIRLWGIVP